LQRADVRACKALLEYALSRFGKDFFLASMASFQWTGQLYDTRGIHPDVVVHSGPTYFLTGGKDNILEEALKRLK